MLEPELWGLKCWKNRVGFSITWLREAFAVVKKFVKPVAGAIVGFALCFSSTVASAAALPSAPAISAPMSISPFVTVSAYGTIQSQSAVCAATAGAVGAAAAAQGQVPAQGCVLPILDPAAPVAVYPGSIAPVASVPVASSGFGLGIFPLLVGLALVAGLAAVLFSGDNDNDRQPVSA